MSQRVSHAVLRPKYTSKKTRQTPNLLLKDKLSERVFNIKEYHTIVAVDRAYSDKPKMRWMYKRGRCNVDEDICGT